MSDGATSPQPPPIDRQAFSSALRSAVERAREADSILGLLLIDLSNLARINRYHSYETGDRILCTAHEQLLSVSKLPDTVFRIGDHRFAFVLPGLGNPGFIALAMNKVEGLLEQELHIDAGITSVDLNIGLAVNRAGERDAMATLALAETSLDHAKLGGSRRLEEYAGGALEDPLDYQLEQNFARALQDNEFELFFQPKVHLATGVANNAEALLRWFPEGGEPVSPDVVVQLAESSGRSFDLTKWVIHRGLRHVRDWPKALDMRIALNIQAGLVSSPDLPSLLRDALAIWGVEARQITVEITESGIIEDKKSGFDNLLKLRKMGIDLSIDDFGTGYSSLSYFKHIPAAELKIDRSFISSMMTDEQDMELVKIMIHIAHQFGLKVIAEGVEDAATLVRLRELGCDYGQGYYLAKPMSAEDLENWVVNWKGLPS